MAVDMAAMPLAADMAEDNSPICSRSLSDPYSRCATFEHVVHVARGIVDIRADFTNKMAKLLQRGVVRCRARSLQTGLVHDIEDPRIFCDDHMMEADTLLNMVRSNYEGHLFTE